MASPIRIQVFRADGEALEPEPDAEVVVGRRDLIGDSTYPHSDLVATFVHDADGHYVNATGDPDNEPGEGEWLIVVRAPERSLVVQKLTFVSKDGVLRAEAGWKEPDRARTTAATVSIINFEEVRGDPRPKQSLVTIRLFPQQHFVGLGCRDNHGGTRFTLFASGRRDLLYDKQQLNAGAVAILLDALENELIFTVKSAKSSPRDWLVLHRVPKDPEAATPSDQRIGILDFYRLLDKLGQIHPNTVVEAGVFGHSWHQGPIVQDTFDDSDDLTLRFDDDLDGRPKDWYDDGVVAADFPALTEAFQADGRLVMWGCSHMVNVIAEARTAQRELEADRARDSFFPVIWTNRGRLNTTLDHAKRSIAQYVQSTKKGRFGEHGTASGQCTYGGMMARALKGHVPCFVAAPGMGANFGRVKGSRGTSHIVMHVVDGGENKIPFEYYRSEYGEFFETDERLYLNYSKMLDAPLPDPPWSTLRFARYVDEELRFQMLRLPSGMEAVRRRGEPAFKNPAPFERNGEKGHLYLAARGVWTSVQQWGGRKLLTIHDDPDKDVGIFVTETGKTFALETARGKKRVRRPGSAAVLVRVQAGKGPILRH